MKALIIDDEERARHLLYAIVDEYCPAITEILEAEDLPSGVKAIRQHHPELVFLDIEMPGFSGTQILEFFDADEVNFNIIFTTAYSEYAVTAFQMNAVDYLLKPLRPNQVKEAVAKVVSKSPSADYLSNQFEQLKASLRDQQFSKIGLPVSDGLLFIELENIVCMEADGMYTKVYTTNDGSKIVSKPLKYFVQLLSKQSTFYRPHRSHLINIKHVKQFVRKEGNYIVMDNDQMVSVSKEKKEEFLELVNLL